MGLQFREGSLLVFLWVVTVDILIFCGAQDQDYIFTSAGQNEYYHQNPTSYIDSSAGIPFRQSPIGFQTQGSSFPPLGGFFSRDLETSEIPRNLQQTLPQYRQGQEISPTGFGNRIVNTPVGFRPSNNYVQPSTHRPNYSHLFSQAHLKNPSQSEFFLGEVQLDNPLETPSYYNNNFKPLKTDDGNTFGAKNGLKNDILKTRTRFLAPERGGKKLTQIKNYVIDNNGGVYTDTSRTSFSPKTTLTTGPPRVTQRRNPFSPTPKPTERAISFNIRPDKKPFVPNNAKNNEQKNSLDLESLLEEPISDSDAPSNKDNVEVVKSTKKELNESEYEEDTESPSEYEEYEEDEEQDEKRQESELRNNEFEENESENDTENEDHLLNDGRNHLENPTTTEDASYETVTTQTTPKTRQNFQETPDKNDAQTNVVTPIPMMVSMATSINVKKNNFDDNESSKKRVPEVVVSVVTSKTVINNTILGTVTEKSLVTEPIRTTEIINPDNTTDSWVVVASVQTSRSISGARYLPKGIIQDERIKLLNEHDEPTPSSASAQHLEYETSKEIDTTIQTISKEPFTKVETSTKVRTSTESLIEKLERVESDVASGLLTGGFKTDNIAVINAANGMPDREMTTVEVTTASTPLTTKDPYPSVKIRKYSPAHRVSTTSRPGSKERFKKLQTITTTDAVKGDLDLPQGDQPFKGKPNVVLKEDISELLPPGYKPEKEEKPDVNSLLGQILARAKSQENNSSNNITRKQLEDTTRLPEYQPINRTEAKTDEKIQDDVSNLSTPEPKFTSKKPPVTVLDDVSKFLPSGYKEVKSTTRKPPVTVLEDVSKFLPPGYKGFKTTSKPPVTVLDDVSKFLPPGYKASKNQKESKTDSPLKVTKDDADVTKFLPPGYKLSRTTNKPPPTVLDDVSKFLPAGYKQRKYEKGGYKTTEGPKTSTTTTEKPKDDTEQINKDISALLPPGFNGTLESKNSSSENILSNLLPPGFKLGGNNNTENLGQRSTTLKSVGAGEKKQIKLVFPGQKNRKTPKLTTPKYSDTQDEVRPSVPTIHKGWPSRATTEFTGWPTPSTTPISIEKLLEAARAATASSSTTDVITDVSSTTTTTTTTTTTPRPTTPGICNELCELAGTIKILDNEKWNWKPEYLDRNTQEYQDLANAVEDQLNEVYQSSPVLKKWYKNIRVDGFSQGSILVDYFVELNDVGRLVSTGEIKRLFHEALTNQDANSILKQNTSREGKALNETANAEKLTLGQFDVDPRYTDFIVIPKSMYPTVGYAEDNVLLPQWAIAVIVIGLASLLFVIIFGVTVLVNRQKSSKKKGPTPLSEDMLSELNKNHMGGYDNYGAEDLYNMEDVWNDRGYDQKPKKRSSGSINENSTANLYDSWRSDWNGYYYNNYYGNPGSQHSGYSGRRRSDYDTNF